MANSKGAHTPLQIISQLVGPFEEMRSRSVTIEADSVDQAESLKVVVTDDGLADDSVRGVQYKFELKKIRLANGESLLPQKGGAANQDADNRISRPDRVFELSLD